jgi:hydrogenase maturation protease
MKTIIIGMGNPILTDDAIGVLVAREVARRIPADAAIDVLDEVGVGGIHLMELMVGYDRAVLIDALMSGAEPGTVRRFTVAELPRANTLNTASAHDVDLPTALTTGRDLGAHLPPNEAITIIGVEVEEVRIFGEAPTPSVAAALPEAAAKVLESIGLTEGETP